MAICLKFGITETKPEQTTYEATSVLVEQIRCDGAVGKKINLKIVKFFCTVTSVELFCL